MWEAYALPKHSRPETATKYPAGAQDGIRVRPLGHRVPNLATKGPKGQNGSQWLKTGPKWPKVGSKWLKVAQNGPKWLKVARNGPKWLKVAQSGPKWRKIGPKWLKIGPKWLKMTENCSQ